MSVMALIISMVLELFVRFNVCEFIKDFANAQENKKTWSLSDMIVLRFPGLIEKMHPP